MSIKDIQGFIGLDYIQFTMHNEYKICEYCNRFHDIKYYIPDKGNQNEHNIDNTISYCIHCWAWLNINDFNLETGEYKGDLNKEVLFNEIKNAIPIHDKICYEAMIEKESHKEFKKSGIVNCCTNKLCLFNKIYSMNKTNKLNDNLKIKFGLSIKNKKNIKFNRNFFQPLESYSDIDIENTFIII